jgi:putative ABC transport system ATP-binding protein
MLLELRDITYKYTRKSPAVLNNISCSFERGLLYAVMGESGAGKTTLMSIIARLDKPNGGKIYYKGDDVAKMGANRYRANKVSVIFQNYNLLTNYTVLDNITTVLNLSGYKGNYAKRAEELLAEVNLAPEKYKRLAQHLSGGEQQRVAIARALASDAEIILADEPTGNLDKTNSENVMKLFVALKERHQKCVIIVTHSDYVASYADRVVNISDGRII